MKQRVLLVLILVSVQMLRAQPWTQNNAVFNPSGIPSLPFSQPRLADLDADGDFDLIIGSTAGAPVYFRNDGTVSNPHFAAGPALFATIDPLDAEMGVFYDIDADGDPDFISGGFTGLNLFINNGTAASPLFEKVPAFFNGLNVGQLPVPDIADIDNDGDGDLVVGFSESGLLRLYINTGTGAVAAFSESLAFDIGDVGLYAYPVFCDLDADGDQDLICGRDGHNLWLFENTGTPQLAQWTLNNGFFGDIGANTYWNSPGFADLNNDGTFDLVFGTADGPLHYYINTGTPALANWTVNNTLFSGVLDPGGASNPFLFDFDNDGDLDLLTGSQLGNIYFYENTGSAAGPAWQENSSYFASIDHSIYSAVTAGDLDADGLPDLIVGDLNGKLFFHRNTGFGFEWITTVLQNIQLSGWSSPRLVDIDADGDLDIVAGEENGKLNLIKNAGSPETAVWVHIPNFFGTFDIGSNCVPAPVDLDFDGDIDLLCGGSFGDLAYLQNTNGVYMQNNMVIIGLDANQNAAPCFGDLDGDGDPDLVLGEYSGVFSYFRNDFLFVDVPDQNKALTLARAFPNPCSDQLKLSIQLSDTKNVELTVLSSDGKMIRQQTIYADQNELITVILETSGWNKGLYLIKLRAAENEETLKVIRW